MLTLDSSPLADRSPFSVAIPPKRHARDDAARQPLPGAGTLAVLEGTIALASLAVVLIVTNRDAMPQGLDSFLSMRVTLRNIILLAGLVTVWRMLFHLCGLYTTGGVRDAMSENLRVCLACGVGSLLALIIFPLSTLGGGLRPRNLVYFFLITTASTLALRQGRRLLRMRREPRRALIVGTGGRAYALMQRLLADEAIDYEVAGFLDTAASKPATDEIARQRIGTLEDLERLLMQLAIDEVAIALPIKSHYHEIQKAILVCERVGVRTKYEATLFDSQVAWPRYDDPTSPTVTLHVVPSDYRLALKRGLDLIGASAALVVLSPVMVAAMIATKATSRGPVLFTQERYGLNRRRFRIFKFRTMLVDAEELQATLEAQNEMDGPVFKISDDPRVTRVGRFLRRTSIDELPQLVNVLRGEMSLVGPRPLPLRDVTRFTSASDMRRFSVRPGLTCLWQVSGRNSLSFAEWIRLDLKYIDGWSLALDFLILARTVPAVLWRTGAR